MRSLQQTLSRLCELVLPTKLDVGFVRWCDRMFRSAANRARHERLCLNRPEADVVAE